MDAVQLKLQARQQEQRHRPKTVVQHPCAEAGAACSRRGVAVQLLVQKSVHSFGLKIVLHRQKNLKSGSNASHLVLQAGEVVQQASDLIALSRAIKAADLEERHEDVLVVEEERVDALLRLQIKDFLQTFQLESLHSPEDC